MNRNHRIVLALLAACGLATAVGSFTFADSTASAPSAGQPEMQLPPGWTMEDMQAMMAAGTPGKMHERLAQEIGTWHCKTTMWMAPGIEPIQSEGTSEITPLMDGRYVKCEMNGEMPGMGPYQGLAIYGFDNAAQKFVAIWIDNFSTGMMKGVGELSDDGKTLTWEYNGYCPIAKKEIALREVETKTGPNTKTIETFGPDRKTGVEYQMMRLELTKK